MSVRVLAAEFARVVLDDTLEKYRGCRECRVLAATHGPPAAKKAGGRHHRFSHIIRHSLRDGLRLIRDLPGVRDLIVTVACEIITSQA